MSHPPSLLDALKRQTPSRVVAKVAEAEAALREAQELAEQAGLPKGHLDKVSGTLSAAPEGGANGGLYDADGITEWFIGTVQKGWDAGVVINGQSAGTVGVSGLFPSSGITEGTECGAVAGTVAVVHFESLAHIDAGRIPHGVG